MRYSGGPWWRGERMKLRARCGGKDDISLRRVGPRAHSMSDTGGPSLRCEISPLQMPELSYYPSRSWGLEGGDKCPYSLGTPSACIQMPRVELGLGAGGIPEHLLWPLCPHDSFRCLFPTCARTSAPQERRGSFLELLEVQHGRSLGAGCRRPGFWSQVCH